MGKYEVVHNGDPAELQQCCDELKARAGSAVTNSFLGEFGLLISDVEHGARDDFLDEWFSNGHDNVTISVEVDGVAMAQLLLGLGDAPNENGLTELELDTISLNDPDPPAEAHASSDR